MPKIRPEAPALRTLDIARWLAGTRPDWFTVADVVGQYRLDPAEANHRISYLIRYGMVRRLGKIKKAGPGRRQFAYALTKWGRKYVQDQAAKEP